LPVTVVDRSFGLTEHILTGLVVTPTYLLTYLPTYLQWHTEGGVWGVQTPL